MSLGKSEVTLWFSVVSSSMPSVVVKLDAEMFCKRLIADAVENGQYSSIDEGVVYSREGIQVMRLVEHNGRSQNFISLYSPRKRPPTRMSQWPSMMRCLSLSPEDSHLEHCVMYTFLASADQAKTISANSFRTRAGSSSSGSSQAIFSATTELASPSGVWLMRW